MDLEALGISLLAGVIMDRLFGDPVSLPHPVVLFGKVISFFERHLNKGRRRVYKGAITAVSLTVSVFVLSSLLVWGAFLIGRWAGILVMSLSVFYCLAAKTLENEVREVFRACDRSLEEGRRQVSRIVGRDTAALSDREVRTAALETLAENLSDGVVAPMFWYLLLGVPGMFAYKMINTMDSMIGYRNERYLQFGRWAARLDDLVNYIPARLTSFLMIASCGNMNLWKFVRKYGRAHASPNSGYPESALAGILGCRFGGPHDYFGETVYKPFIGENDRPVNTGDMGKAIYVNRTVEGLMVISMLGCYAILYFI